MGKKGGSSWLTAVKRAFRSPSKDSEKKSSRRKVEHQQEEEEDKRTDRRRWLFRKHNSSSNIAQLSEAKETTDCMAPKTPVLPAEQRHAIAVAAATAAAAEAAVATAKAAVEIIRLSAQPSSNATSFKQHSAARVIQTAFRGYLARRALVALKGIVKLQALIRGQNVRKQANMTMKCMQALLRVQARVRDQRARLSHDGGRRSMFAETNNLWESKYLKDIRERKSRSREGSCVTDDWRDCPRTLEELEAILKARNEAALTHEKSLAFAFSQQNKILDSDRIPYDGEENEVENRTNWLDRWMAAKQWENSSRASTDYRRDSIKTVEVDSLRTSSYSATNGRKSRCQSPIHRQAAASPHHRSFHNAAAVQSPATPSLISKTRTAQVRPASPRCLKEEKSYSTANTPSLRSTQRYNSSVSRYSTSVNEGPGNASIPNYMAATESAKARIRSQSAPRQRPSTPERDRGGSARKRLSYPIPEPYCVNFGFGCNGFGQNNLRSPSFKSVQAGYVGMEEQSNYSCYTESIGGEISPCSTTDLRRWLR
ncbi:protein IQ-DOMAIN 1 [Sesamum angolense]|uniref:Protein IQ-DOMAIN 1 n=1 Tax=Sesamum angolense TaxID=2727404 RepID=A0AAE2BWC5_9LAMI|nr:protein IQ-DOMAIN 1 [Sesamum angolense]